MLRVSKKWCHLILKLVESGVLSCGGACVRQSHHGAYCLRMHSYKRSFFVHPIVPTHSLAKLQPSEQSWEYLCVLVSHDFWNLNIGCLNIYIHQTMYVILLFFSSTHIHSHIHISLFVITNINFSIMCCATAGQEDPFELDSNLLLSSGRHGEDCKRQYFCTIMKHRYLTIWLTYCTWHCLLWYCLSW